MINVRAFFQSIWGKRGPKRQLQRFRTSLQLDAHEPVYQQLFATAEGFALSRQARKVRDAFEYTYGEIDFVSFIALLSLVKPNAQTVFYDLGSGIGTAVLACAMVYPVKKSVGIECFLSLHDHAVLQTQRLLQNPNYQRMDGAIEFIHADFLDASLADATLIFINATAYFGETWERLNQKLESLECAITVMTTSKPLMSARYHVIHQTRMRVSWGEVEVYIHERDNI